jgi:hypothetical protein
VISFRLIDINILTSSLLRRERYESKSIAVGKSKTKISSANLVDCYWDCDWGLYFYTCRVIHHFRFANHAQYDRNSLAGKLTGGLF